MRLSVTAALAGLCASAHAFSDSSPFILFSTAKLSTPTSLDQLQSSSRVLESTKQLLSSCPTNHYLFVSQPNLNAAHLSSKAAVPQLTDSLDHAMSSYSIAEVAGELDVRDIAAYVREKCGLARSAVDVITLAPVPSSAAGSKKALKENDDELGAVLAQYKASAGDSYTVIYAGGARTEKPQSSIIDEAAGPSELKKRQVKREQQDDKKLSLFDRYQYFTPGIFMAFIVLIILMSILYVGISAVASLQVSYGAFDKDMGPAAQKKQQ